MFFYLIYRKFAAKGYEALSKNIRLLWRVSNHLREFYLQSNENQKATENWFNIFLSLSSCILRQRAHVIEILNICIRIQYWFVVAALMVFVCLFAKFLLYTHSKPYSVYIHRFFGFQTVDGLVWLQSCKVFNNIVSQYMCRQCEFAE